MVSSVWVDSATCSTGMAEGGVSANGTNTVLIWENDFGQTVSAQVALSYIQYDSDQEDLITSSHSTITATIYRYITTDGNGSGGGGDEGGDVEVSDVEVMLNSPILNTTDNVRLIEFLLSISGTELGSIRDWKVAATMVATVFVQ